jgi:hypothetical protein
MKNQVRQVVCVLTVLTLLAFDAGSLSPLHASASVVPLNRPSPKPSCASKSASMLELQRMAAGVEPRSADVLAHLASSSNPAMDSNPPQPGCVLNVFLQIYPGCVLQGAGVLVCIQTSLIVAELFCRCQANPPCCFPAGCSAAVRTENSGREL